MNAFAFWLAGLVGIAILVALIISGAHVASL
jgi:hypothetical protein